jgi:hypothetical protein
LRICFMGKLIYVILCRLRLVNEQNAMINLKNDMVKNIQKPDDKKIPSILALKKSGHYTNVDSIVNLYK